MTNWDTNLAPDYFAGRYNSTAILDLSIIVRQKSLIIKVEFLLHTCTKQPKQYIFGLECRENAKTPK